LTDLCGDWIDQVSGNASAPVAIHGLQELAANFVRAELRVVQINLAVQISIGLEFKNDCFKSLKQQAA
jgi:hypothetical protein